MLVHRIKSGKSGILAGRSECPNCSHVLGAKELIPLFSWLAQRGKCAHCRKKIPASYPLLELATGFLFVFSGLVLCDPWAIVAGDSAEILRLVLFLMVALVTVTYVFYDLLFTEVPDEVMLPAIFAVMAVHLFAAEPNAVFRHFVPLDGAPVWKNALYGALGAYSFFYIQFLIPAVGHFLRKHEWKSAVEVVAYYAYLPVAVVKDWLLSIAGKRPPEPSDATNEEEIPSWIGLWDLRIAVLMGLLLGAKMTGVALFFAYLVGSVYGVYVLAVLRKRNSTVPFGPFLAAGFYLSLAFYAEFVAFVFPHPFP